MPTSIDERFLDLPLRRIADAALGKAAAEGASRASARVERVREAALLLHDGELVTSRDTVRSGLAVSAARGPADGFAADPETSAESAARTAARAVGVARLCAPLADGSSGPPGRAAFADEPVHDDVTWSSSYRINPFDVPDADRSALLARWSRRLLAAPEVRHVSAKLRMTQENKFYADTAGTVVTQQRIRVHPQVVVFGVHPRTGAVSSLRTLGPPTGRGWEYLTGTGWDWEAEIGGMPALLGAKLAAPAMEPGSYDLVIDPSNLWLTIHETVGHATELDRALGHEMGYAGGTFATPDRLGALRYGSDLMHVTADRTAPHGLATVGFDDEGVAAQSWDLVTGGVLSGFQTDRRSAGLIGADRSRGCAFAESAAYRPLQRMPNVSLRPQADGPSTSGLIEGVSDGIYIVGSNSWSIDNRRSGFQFTAQHCHRIRNGELTGQVRDVAYRGDTTGFWASLSALGGPGDYRTFGADLCGKGQPTQISAAGHGCPAAVFENVRVLNASREAGL